MTCEEIFTKLAEHQINGMMVHEQLANYYDFLGLPGYRNCHEYHFMAESCTYRKICRYYVNHYNKLIPVTEFDTPEVVPESWYKYNRQDVDISTKKNAIKSGLEEWVDWETETKKLYSDMYKEAIENGSIDAADFIQGLVADVSNELKKATMYWLNKEAINYDMSVIISEQKEKSDKYKAKLRLVGNDLC